MSAIITENDKNNKTEPQALFCSGLRSCGAGERLCVRAALLSFGPFFSGVGIWGADTPAVRILTRGG
ncbi:MAG: hypothetical protein LBS82_01015 [Spirochaetaceae bacterium]|nr:hypothetical protein [Spirochaetaceae bacterium]